VHGSVEEDVHARGSTHKVKERCVIVCVMDIVVQYSVVVWHSCLDMGISLTHDATPLKSVPRIKVQVLA